MTSARIFGQQRLFSRQGGCAGQDQARTGTGVHRAGRIWWRQLPDASLFGMLRIVCRFPGVGVLGPDPAGAAVVVTTRLSVVTTRLSRMCQLWPGVTTQPSRNTSPVAGSFNIRQLTDVSTCNLQHHF